ncbi:Protein of unknown function [Gryllus bimaculatus]|nr:Protein of unknown function [Gryllus bimaculatus]
MRSVHFNRIIIVFICNVLRESRPVIKLKVH